jgi:23S rRNA (guanosine2251-2'-O)-methyltransferase
MYLTGFHAIEEALKNSTNSCVRLLVAKAGPRARELVEMARLAKVPTERTGTSVLDRIDGNHRGIALELSGEENEQAGTYSGIEDFLNALNAREDGGANSLVIVCDEITYPHNYGAILRSSDQFGVDLVLTRKRRTAINAPVVAQTSAGAAQWVSQVEVGYLREAVDVLKKNNFWVYGADMAGEKIWSKDLRGRTVIILGAEGAGISRLLRECCDGFVRVPQNGHIESLNVSVAAGIIMYEIARQKNGK